MQQKKYFSYHLPIAFPSDKERLLLSIREQGKINKSLIVSDNYNFKNKYPNQWVFDNLTSNDYLYYPKIEIIARDKTNTLPENPWSMGGGYSDYICVDSKKTSKLFARQWDLKKEGVITGQIEHDYLYNNFSEEKK